MVSTTALRRAFILVSYVCLLLPGLGNAQEYAVRNGVSFLVLPYATVQRNAIWERKSIEVCWENPTASDGQMRAIVREAVDDSWSKFSQLRFTGWSSCTKTSQGIRIRIEDKDIAPHVEALGSYLDARPNGMILNFSFSRWGQSCLERIAFCVRAIAVHEFGHAIGFAHEQNRSDAPPECQLDAQGPDGDWNVTEYDPYSIMNYCNPSWLGDGKLSQRDIDAVSKIYLPR